MGEGLSLRERLGAMSARKRKELFKLIGYLIAVVVPAPWIFEMLVAGWNTRPWGYARHLTQGFINATGIDPAVPYVVGVSLYIGLGLSLLVDSYKRFQGLLLWIAILLGSSLVLTTETELIDVFVESIRPESGVLVVFFITCGMYLAGVRPGHIRQMLDKLWRRLFVQETEEMEAGQLHDSSPIEIRTRPLGLISVTPPLVLFLVTAVVIGYGAIEAVVDYHPTHVVTQAGVALREEGIGIDGLTLGGGIGRGLVGSVAFLTGLYHFTSYENSVKVMQIGPARSGKSAEFGGLQLSLENFRDADYRDATGTGEIRSHLLDGEFPPPTENVDLRWLEIEYKSGTLFPEKFSLQTIDYGGGLLRDVLAEVEGRDIDVDLTERASSWAEAKRGVERLDTTIDTGGVDDGDVTTGRIASAIWDCVRHADRIVLTVPLDDFLGPIVARGNESESLDIIRKDDYETEAERKEALGIREAENIPSAVTFEYEGETFYISGDEDRQPRTDPEDYLNWYRLLQSDSRFKDDVDFLCAVTKSDYAIEDFGTEGESRTPLADYPEFRRHIYDEVLSESSGVLRENYAVGDIWPVWYKVAKVEDAADGEDEFRIVNERDSRPLLRGSRKLLDRLER